jgi:hypothetical protein
MFRSFKERIALRDKARSVMAQSRAEFEQRSREEQAAACPSFVLGETYTARVRQPLIVSERRGRTRAIGYQAGPFTTFAPLRSARGEATITRC